MDPEFSRLVDGAAAIANSGRWEAVNRRIEVLASNPGQGNVWWVQLFGSLCYQNFSEYLALKRAYEDKRHDDLALLAWRGRNLLELSVWANYCAKSSENARRLFEDIGRDLRGILDAFIKWGTATSQGSDWHDSFSTAKQDLAARALVVDNIESIDGPFKAVRDAATECGIGENFSVSFKLLSKFAHPTAMRIIVQPDTPIEATLRDLFFSQGCLFFYGGIPGDRRQVAGLICALRQNACVEFRGKEQK